jgi:thioredoxin reductase (NADPH)
MSTLRARPLLSSEQLDTLSALGEERRAEVGEVLFTVGDHEYPFIVILDGEAAILDAYGSEIVRHGAAGFLGEANLLTGQTVYVTAVATAPMRYIDRERLRQLIDDDSSLSSVFLDAFSARREVLQSRAGVGLQIVGPRTSTATLAIVDYARRSRLPFSWYDTDSPARDEAQALIADLSEAEVPLVRLPGGAELRNPSPSQLSHALGIGLTLCREEEVDLLIVGGGPAGLGAAVYGASEGLNTLIVEGAALGGQAGVSRRIENYLGFPAGISGSELTMRAIMQARKFKARCAAPYRAIALEPGEDVHIVRLEDGHRVAARVVMIATGAEYRRLPVPAAADYEGSSVLYAAGPPDAHRCAAKRVAVVGGGNSAAQAAIWLARCGALVTLLHRRVSLSETMSDYLIADLGRHGVKVRDRCEVGDLHGANGQLDAITLKSGERLPVSFLFLFLGAAPATDWLSGVVARDEHGFVLTGDDAGADRPLESSVRGVFAAGDVRSGSIKRCATAVGEGAMVVRFAHERMTGVPA